MYHVENGGVYLGEWAEELSYHQLRDAYNVHIGFGAMCADFDIEPEDVTMDVLFAYYCIDVYGYDGYAFVLLQDDKGKLWSVDGGHCSCYGLEGQGEPMKKVTAFQTGTIEHQTEKAIKLSGTWFPKATVVGILKGKEGCDVLVLKDWFVAKNRHYAYTELGELRTKFVELEDGTILFQGNVSKVSIEQDSTPEYTDDELDDLVDGWIANGMSWKDATKKARALKR